jgi:hypothetical protein
MTSSWRNSEHQWEEKVERQLRELGYEVIIEPRREHLPFDLAGYRPDLLATRGDGGLIIELKSSEKRTVVDTYVEVAALVKQHPGWRFLLVPVERLEEGGIVGAMHVSTWDQLAERVRAARLLLEGGQVESAFLIAWSGLEGALRRVGEENAVPVSALSTTALTKNLYSLGLLSMEQLSRIEQLTAVRNNVVHGWADARVSEGAPEVIRLLETLLRLPPQHQPTRD